MQSMPHAQDQPEATRNAFIEYLKTQKNNLLFQMPTKQDEPDERAGKRSKNNPL
jgi:hypothetical protein